MSGFPFDPGRLAALSRLADSINGQHAPPPINGGVEISDGRVIVPVPDASPTIVVDQRMTSARIEQKTIVTALYPGLTLQWSQLREQDGLVLSLWGGSPDGDETKDGVACFLTRRGLRSLIRDLQMIAAALEPSA